MKQFFESKPGKIILFVIVAIIWGWNFVSFSELAGEEDESRSGIYEDITADEYTIPEFDRYKYPAGGRNPFGVPSGFEARQIREQVKDLGEEYQRPNIILSGVMEGMAILRDQQGQTFFVEEDDTFNSILVQKIYRDSVRLVHNDKTFTINLN